MPRTVHQADKLTGDVSLNDYVTGGRGTDESPWIGSASVGDVPSGTHLRARPGYYYFAAEILFANPGVSITGAGINHTVIRCDDAGEGKAVMRFSRPDATESRYIEVGGFTLDGMGVTSCGLYLRDVNFSTIRPFRVINTTDYVGKATRGVGNTWDAIRCHTSDADMTTVPTNGMYFSDVDVIMEDNATTVSTVHGLLISGLPGVGLEVHNAFGIEFRGSCELCGTPLKLGADTRQLNFDGFNMEQGVGGGDHIQIAGFGHLFAQGDYVGSNIAILAGSTGGHVFDRCTGIVAVSDAGTGVNTWHDPAIVTPFIARITGTNRRNNVQRWGTETYRLGDAGETVVSVASADAAVALGTAYHELYVTGSKVAGWYQVPGGAMYGISGGGIADRTQATLEGVYAVKVDGRNVTIGGTLAASSLDVAKTGNSMPTATSTDSGGVAGFQGYCAGSTVMHVVQYPGGAAYGMSTGGVDLSNPATRLANLEANYAIGWSGANVRIRGHLGVGNAAAATTPGSVVKKIEIFDSATGASLGFVPVYNAIT